MKDLTLIQLREAIEAVMSSKKFRGIHASKVVELERASYYMQGLLDETDLQPVDPREILTEIGYEW